MVFCNELCCNQCRKLFNDVDRKPLTGSCAHSICELCWTELRVSTCPNCGACGAFVEEKLAGQLERDINEFRRRLDDDDLISFAEAHDDLSYGRCKHCRVETRSLQICVDCSAGLVQLTPGKFYQLNTTPELLEADAVRVLTMSMCSECARKHHFVHVVLPIDALPNFPKRLERSNMWTGGLVLQETVPLREEMGRWKDAVRFFEQVLVSRLVRVRVDPRAFLDKFKMFRCETREFASVDESFAKASDVYMKNERLQERVSLNHINHITEHLVYACHESTRDVVDVQQRLEAHTALEAFRRIQGQMNDVFDATLTEEGLRQIDDEVNSRMEASVAEFKARARFPEPVDSNYVKFRVIQEELKAFQSRMPLLIATLLTKVDEMRRMCAKHRGALEQLQAEMRRVLGVHTTTLDVFRQQQLSELKIQHYALSRELLEKQEDVHKALVDVSEMNLRKTFADLQKCAVFGRELTAKPENRVYLDNLRKTAETSGIVTDTPIYTSTLQCTNIFI